MQMRDRRWISILLVLALVLAPWPGIAGAVAMACPHGHFHPGGQGVADAAAHHQVPGCHKDARPCDGSCGCRHLSVFTLPTGFSVPVSQAVPAFVADVPVSVVEPFPAVELKPPRLLA